MLRPNLNRSWRQNCLWVTRFAGVVASVFTFSVFVPAARAASPKRSSTIGDSERIELTHGFVRTRGSTLAQRKIARSYADRMVNSNTRALVQCFTRARLAAMQMEKAELTRHRMTIQFTLDPRAGISDMQIVSGEFSRTVDSECVMLRLLFTEGSLPELESAVTVYLPLRFDYRTKRSTHILPLGPGGVGMTMNARQSSLQNGRVIPWLPSYSDTPGTNPPGWNAGDPCVHGNTRC